MTDSRISQNPDVQTRHASPPSERSYPVRVVEAPRDIENNREPQQISGRVLPSSSNTEVRVLTEQGEVVILQANSAQPLPREGQRVIISVTPEQLESAVLTIVSRQISNPQAVQQPDNNVFIQPRGAATPVSVDIRIIPPQNIQRQNTDLIGQILTLSPISTNDAINLLSSIDTREITSNLEAFLSQQSPLSPREGHAVSNDEITLRPLTSLVSPQDEAFLLEVYFTERLSIHNQSAQISSGEINFTVLDEAQVFTSRTGTVSYPRFTSLGSVVTISINDFAGPKISDGSTFVPVEVRARPLEQPVFPFNAVVNQISSPSERVFSSVMQSFMSSDNEQIPPLDFEQLSDVRAGQVRLVLLAQAELGDFLALRFNEEGKPVPEFYRVPVEAYDSLKSGQQIDLIPIPDDIVLEKNANIQSSAVLLPNQGIILTTQPWPLMNEVYETLLQFAPQQAQAMVNVTPSLSNPGQIPAATLFFIAAVRGGSMTSWLGDRAFETLRQAGRDGLLSRLTQERGMQSRLAMMEPVSSEWRAANVPFLYEGQFQRVVLFFRKDQEQSEASDQGRYKSTRFIFDLTLEAMGPLQLDGLFRAGRLDLIVRSQENFSSGMQQEMRRLYSGALRASGVTGELTFQKGYEHWVTITPDANSKNADTLV